MSDGQADPPPKLTRKLLAQLVAGVMSDDLSAQLECTRLCRKALSADNPPIAAVIAAGVLPRFVEFLRFEDRELQVESAWVLTNITAGFEPTQKVVDSGAVPILVDLVRSPHEDVRHQCVWALANIAGESTALRNLVLEQGVIPPLLDLLESSTQLSVTRTAAWALSNMCRGKPSPPFELVHVALPALSQMLHLADEEVLSDACWTLSYLSDGPNTKIKAVVEAGVCRRLTELLLHASVNVHSAALSAVGNIVTGEEAHVQTLLNCSVLAPLRQLLSHPQHGMRKQVCWALSNIACEKEHIDDLFAADIFPRLFDLSGTDKSAEVRDEACWAILTAVFETNQHLGFFVEQGVVALICRLLARERVTVSTRLLWLAIECLEKILDGGFDTVALLAQLEQCGALLQLKRLEEDSWQGSARAACVLERALKWQEHISRASRPLRVVCMELVARSQISLAGLPEHLQQEVQQHRENADSD
eukprot:TRINITY_DN6559_c0_g1_i2.p1 TRINITY_DN6559_c0_g1~~TRINITY_DN6559_c0_g1_i2.p1  ORF type:complete len:476 (+),score=110.81 TRINITY_DN6559_c0_g1_i2:27-1454(+)